MNASTDNREQKPDRGQPIAGRKVLENLSFNTRTTGEAAAARSRLVRRLRLILPGFAVLLIAAFIFNTRSNDVNQAFLDDFKDLSGSTEELRMANPRFDGIDEKGNPFEITAAAAIQNPEMRDVVQLENPKAVQGALDKRTAVTARKGVYSDQNKILELTDSVELEHQFADEIYVLRLPSATVSINDETVVSNTGVGGEGSDGASLEADQMTAYNADRRVVFEGNVRMRIYPKTAEKKDTESDDSAPEE